MKQSDLLALFDATTSLARNILLKKGLDAALQEDRFANFDKGARVTGSTPPQVCLLKLSTNFDEIAQAVRALSNGAQVRHVLADGKPILDLINYGILLLGIFREIEAKQEAARAEYDANGGT